MNCSSANALAASHADALTASPSQSGLLLPFLVVMAMERHVRFFIARLNAQDVREESALPAEHVILLGIVSLLKD